MVAANLEQPRAAAMVRRMVLIVEDEALIRMLLADVLRQEDFDVVEAASADEALSVLRSQPGPDILVTDVRMPGLVDGLALAAYARRQRPDLKVIITSGHAGADGAAGLADAFLAKPYDLSAIVGSVRLLTEGRTIG